MSSLAVPHVTLPPSFREALRELMLPIAVSMRPRAPVAQWAPAWGIAESEHEALARMIVAARTQRSSEPLRSAMASGAGPKKSVRFAGGEAVDVQFFAVDSPPPEPPVYAASAGLKAFDGPSGHKMRRSVCEGDPEEWDEISRLMAIPRGSVCWSHTW